MHFCRASRLEGGVRLLRAVVRRGAQPACPRHGAGPACLRSCLQRRDAHARAPARHLWPPLREGAGRIPRTAHPGASEAGFVAPSLELEELLESLPTARTTWCDVKAPVRGVAELSIGGRRFQGLALRRHRGLEANGKEDELLCQLLGRQPEAVEWRVDHPDVGPCGAGLAKALPGARNAQQVAEGADGRPSGRCRRTPQGERG